MYGIVRTESNYAQNSVQIEYQHHECSDICDLRNPCNKTLYESAEPRDLVKELYEANQAQKSQHSNAISEFEHAQHNDNEIQSIPKGTQLIRRMVARLVVFTKI
jgi:hypothetical protein